MNKIFFLIFSLYSFVVFCAEYEDFVDEQNLTGENFRRYLEQKTSREIATEYFPILITNSEEGEDIGSEESDIAYEILCERSRKNRSYLDEHKELGPNEEDKFLFAEMFGDNGNSSQLSELNGLSFDEAVLWNCMFYHADLTKITFNNAKLICTCFDACNLFNVSFTNAKTMDLRITECSLNECGFEKACLNNLYARANTLTEISFESASLKKAFFSGNFSNLNCTGSNLCDLRLGENITMQGKIDISGALVDFVNAHLEQSNKAEFFFAPDFFKNMGALCAEDNPLKVLCEPYSSLQKRSLSNAEMPPKKKRK